MRAEAELSAIRSHFKCELSTLSSKIESLTTSLNGALKKIESHPHKCCSIVEDNLFFLKKELLSKDDVIKSLVETQTAILNSISNTASDKQTATTPSVWPNLCEKQQRKHRVQHSTQQQIKNQQKRKKNKLWNKRNNLNELFGVKTTHYLQESWQKTGKLFILCPDHVFNELIKLNGIYFLKTYIIVEAAPSTRSRVSQGATNSVTRRLQVAVNHFPENQDVYFKSSVVPDNRSCAETMQSLRTVIIFADSIPQGIRIHEFNSLVRKSYAKMKPFPEATSKKLLHYVDPTLKDWIYITAIIHVEVHNLLNNKNTNKVDELVNNLKSTAIKCISNGIAKVVVSGNVMNNKMSDSFIGDVNKKIAMMCKKNSLVYMDNANIPKSCLFTDGLHLVEKGKCILANNFINILNSFLGIHQHHLTIHKH